jgi:hypothetical protein
MQILKIKSSCFPALAGLPTRRDATAKCPACTATERLLIPAHPRQMRIFRARTDEAGGGAAAEG